VMLLGGVVVHRIVRRYQHELEYANRDLRQTLDERLSQGLATRTALILGLAKLADYRDTDTGAHLERICEYSEALARAARPHFKEINDTWITHLKPAASLHDIGKVGVPDHILLKAGKLTPPERKIIEKHTYMGADTLIAIRSTLGDDELIDLAIQIALFHHERWDGTGYPMGVSGDQIPLSARIVALADVYDALTSRRVYKQAMTHEAACDVILSLSGKHFDPAVIEAFVLVQAEFDRIRNRLQPFTDLVEAAHAKAA
jgi:response regulator RpfG family c-di-GMP phosphodiesterase